MPTEIFLYQLHELCNKHPQVLIQTEPGVEVSIELKPEGTVISFTHANEIEAHNGKLIVKPVKLKN